MAPVVTESKIDWAIAVRKFISLQMSEQLQEAIRLAQKSGENEVAEILFEETKRTSADSDFRRRRENYEHLITSLLTQNRAEEALTLGLLDLNLDTTLVTTFRHLSINDPMRAFNVGMQACQECVNLSKHLNDSACEAHYLTLMAKGFYSINQSERAIEHFTHALERYENLTALNPKDFAPLTASALAGVGESRRISRQFSAAIDSLTGASEMFRRLSESERDVYEPKLGNVLNSLGLALDESKQFRRSIETLNEALMIFRRVAASDPTTYEKDVAMVLNNLGIVQRETRQLEQAIASLSEALEIRRRLSLVSPRIFEPLVATTLSNVGNVHRELNRYQEALGSYSEATSKLRDLARSSPPVYRALLGLTLNNMGLAHSELNQPEQAVKCYSEALEIRRLLAQHQAHIHEPDVAQTLVNIGVTQRNLTQFELAIESLTEALVRYRTLAKYDSQLYDMHVARALHYLGTVHIRMSSLNQAREFYTEALEIRRRLAKAEPHIYEPDVVVTLSDLGFLSIKTQEFSKAAQLLQEAKAIAENSRDQTQDLVRRNQAFQEHADVYRYLMVCYVKLNEWTKALETAEQGKSRSLNDLLNLKVIRPKFSLNRTPTENELGIVEQLANSYERALTRIQQVESSLRALYSIHEKFQGNKEQADDTYLAEVAQIKSNIRQQIEELKRRQLDGVTERNHLLQKIREFDPNFPPRSHPLSVDQILDVSEKSNRTIVLFRVTEVGTFCFVIFPDRRFELVQQDDFTSGRLGKLIKNWFEPYFNHSTVGFMERMKPLLAEVYEGLLKPVHDLIRSTKYSETLFVPTGALSVLPLHACCWQENSQTHYLLDELTISYAASISVFKIAWESAQQRKRCEKFFFVTNPTQDLKFADQEVDEIISFLKALPSQFTEFRHEQAVKESVKTQMRREFGFYHFACHGNYNWHDAFSSPLWMSGKRMSAKEKSNLTIEEKYKITAEESRLNLTLREIMEANLGTAWLTTLSACETGLVDFNDETDEHYGFPLGLIFAGSPSVWATLWQVDDKATSELMARAYRNLLQLNKPKSEALRHAQIEYRKEKEKEGSHCSSPYYWAGFQHYGV